MLSGFHAGLTKIDFKKIASKDFSTSPTKEENYGHTSRNVTTTTHNNQTIQTQQQ